MAKGEGGGWDKKCQGNCSDKMKAGKTSWITWNYLNFLVLKLKKKIVVTSWNLPMGYTPMILTWTDTNVWDDMSEI